MTFLRLKPWSNKHNTLSQHSPTTLGPTMLRPFYHPRNSMLEMFDDVRCCVKFDFSQILTQQRRTILSRFPMLRSFDHLKTTLLLLSMRMSNLCTLNLITRVVSGIPYCFQFLRPFDQSIRTRTQQVSTNSNNVGRCCDRLLHPFDQGFSCIYHCFNSNIGVRPKNLGERNYFA